MDYSKYLILYSGGADSTYFIEREQSAKHLIHYQGYNNEQTKAALINSNLFNKYLTIEDVNFGHTMDGETNEFHALCDTQMALHASIKAVSFGLKGIVMCFNRDDLGIDIEALTRIVKRCEPEFDVVMPLIDVYAKEIREYLDSKNIYYISCMHSSNCGHCAKCLKKY